MQVIRTIGTIAFDNIADMTKSVNEVVGCERTDCCHIQALRYIIKHGKTMDVAEGTILQIQSTEGHNTGVASVIPLWGEHADVEEEDVEKEHNKEGGIAKGIMLFSVCAVSKKSASDRIPLAVLTCYDSIGWSCVMDNHYDCIHVQGACQFLIGRPVEMQKVKEKVRGVRRERGTKYCIRSMSGHAVKADHVTKAAQDPVQMSEKYTSFHRCAVKLTPTVPVCVCNETDGSDIGRIYCFCTTCLEKESNKNGCICGVTCRHGHAWNPASISQNGDCVVYGAYGGTHKQHRVPVMQLHCSDEGCREVLVANGYAEGVFLYSPRVGFELSYMQQVMDLRHVGGTSIRACYNVLQRAVRRQGGDVEQVGWREFYGAVTAYSLQSDVKFPWECPICKTPGSPSFKYIVADGTHSASTSQHHWVDPGNWRKSHGESLCEFTCAMEKCL